MMPDQECPLHLPEIDIRSLPLRCLRLAPASDNHRAERQTMQMLLYHVPSSRSKSHDSSSLPKIIYIETRIILTFKSECLSWVRSRTIYKKISLSPFAAPLCSDILIAIVGQGGWDLLLTCHSCFDWGTSVSIINTFILIWIAVHFDN